MSVPALLAFCAQLTAIWLALAPGLVVCMEEDGRFAVEASVGGEVCGDMAPSHTDHSPILAGPASGHCGGCLDVPLFLSGDVAAGHQHATPTSVTDVATPAAGVALVARLTDRQRAIPSAERGARMSSRRTTVLRI